MWPFFTRWIKMHKKLKKLEMQVLMLEAELEKWKQKYYNIKEWKDELTEEVHSYEDGGD